MNSVDILIRMVCFGPSVPGMMVVITLWNVAVAKISYRPTKSTQNCSKITIKSRKISKQNKLLKRMEKHLLNVGISFRVTVLNIEQC